MNGFFDICKASRNIVVHFFRESTWRCKIVDKHLDILAKDHIETRFIKIDAEKAPFLVERYLLLLLYLNIVNFEISVVLSISPSLLLSPYNKYNVYLFYSLFSFPCSHS